MKQAVVFILLAFMTKFGASQCVNTVMFSQEFPKSGNLNVVANLSDNHYDNNSFISYTYTASVNIWGEEFGCEGCTKRLNQASVIKQNENGQVVGTWSIAKPVQSRWYVQKVFNDTVYLLLRTFGDTLFTGGDTTILPNGGLSLIKLDIDLNYIETIPLVSSLGTGGVSSFMGLLIDESKLRLAIALRGSYDIGVQKQNLDFSGVDNHLVVLNFSKNGNYKYKTTSVIDDFLQIKGIEGKDESFYVGAIVNNVFKFKGKRIAGISGEEAPNETDFVLFEYRDTSLIKFHQLGTLGSDDGGVFDYSEEQGLLFGVSTGSTNLEDQNEELATYNSPYNAALLRLYEDEIFIEKTFESPDVDDLDCTDPILNSVQYLSGNQILVGVNYNDELKVGDQVFTSKSELKSRNRRNSIMLVIGGDSIKKRLEVTSPGSVSCSFSGINSDYEVMIYGYADDRVNVANESYSFSNHSFQINLCIDSFETGMKKGFISNSKIELYPNPVKDVLYLSGLREKVNVELINIYGQQVDFVEKRLNQYDVSNLPKGFYILKLKLEDGNSAEMVFIKH